MRTSSLVRLPVLLFAFRFLLSAQLPATPPAYAPDASEPQTRIQLIEAERKAKAAAFHAVHPNPVVNAVEQFVSHGLTIWNATQSGTHGLSANIGGLSVGSQIAVGPEYTLKLGDYYHPQLVWDTFAVGAADKSYRMQTGVQLPRLSKGRFFFGLDGYRYQYTRLLYFGPGDGATKTGISDYSQHENGFEMRAGMVIHGRIRAGITGSYRSIAIGPGTATNLPATDSVYAIADARGIDRQTDFLAGGFFAEYDSRDQPGDPHHGTLLSAHFQNINGSRRALGGFNQYDFDGQFYLPFWNHSRVVAFRARSSLTTPHENTFVPFYMEPRLGGADDLRGFGNFRFHDQNSVIASAEYRWNVVPLLDMVLFADAGKVYHDADQITFDHFMTDIGFGFRARTGNSVPFKFDVGVSREGVQIWLILVNLF